MPGQTRRNFSAAAAQIEATYAALGGSVPSGMRMIGEEILTDCITSVPGRGVPRDEGHLADSGRVDGPTGPRHEVTISFGGAAAPYALRQHEELYWHHRLGEARYLVRALFRWRGNGVAVKAAYDEMLKALKQRPNKYRPAAGGTP